MTTVKYDGRARSMQMLKGYATGGMPGGAPAPGRSSGSKRGSSSPKPMKAALRMPAGAVPPIAAAEPGIQAIKSGGRTKRASGGGVMGPGPDLGDSNAVKRASGGGVTGEGIKGRQVPEVSGSPHHPIRTAVSPGGGIKYGAETMPAPKTGRIKRAGGGGVTAPPRNRADEARQAANLFRQKQKNTDDDED